MNGICHIEGHKWASPRWACIELMSQFLIAPGQMSDRHMESDVQSRF